MNGEPVADRRAAERCDRAGAAGPGADLRRGRGHRQRQDRRLRARQRGLRAAAEVAGEPRSGRHGQIQDVAATATTSATASRFAQFRAISSRLSRFVDTPAAGSLQWRTTRAVHSVAPHPDDRCHRKSEGRRREDHDRHQPGGRACPCAASRRCSSISIPRPTARCRFSTSPTVTRSVYDAIVRAERAASPTSSCRRRSRTCSSRRRGSRWPSSKAKLVGELDAHFRLKDRLEPIRDAVPEHRHRLPADAGPADGQRAGRGDAPADSDSVVVLRARGHRRSAGDDREGPRPRQPGAADSRRRDHDARQADGAGARHPIADREGVRRARCSRPSSPRACGSRRARPTRNRSSRSRRNRPARPSTTACARRSSIVPKRGLAGNRPHAPRRALRRGADQLRRQRRSGGWCRSTRSIPTRTSRARSWATCRS